MPDVFNFIPERISDSFLGSILLSHRATNNRWATPPNVQWLPFTTGAQEKWITITGCERDVYLTTAELRIVVNRIGSMFANGVWVHKDRNGEPIDFKKSEALQRLNKPNFFQGRKMFLTQLFLQRSLYGNCFTYQHRGSRLQEIPTALWNLSPSRMKVLRTGIIWSAESVNDMIAGYVFRNDGGRADEEFETDDIILFSIPDSDDPVLGESPLIGIRPELSNIRASKTMRNVLLTKKGALGALSSVAKDAAGSVPLTPEEERKIIEQAQRMYGIGDEQLSFMVSQKELKWTSFIQDVDKMQLFTELDSCKRTIIDTFGGNDNMFSRPASGKGDTFTNVEMGERICYVDTIIPLAEDTAKLYADRWGITDRGETLCLEYGHLPVMQADQEKASKIVLNQATALEKLILNGYSKDQAALIVKLDVEKKRVRGGY